jgi:hypothetical protein
MKSNVLRDLNALLYINRMTFKNHVRQIFENPFKTVMSVLKWVFYFAIMFSPLLIQLATNSTKKSSQIQSGLSTAKPYVNGILLLLLLIFVFYSLKKAIDDYKPTIFRAADANLVFSSPLDRRTVYFFAVLRAMFGNLMSVVIIVCVFLTVTLSLRLSLVTWAIPLAVIGLFSFAVFMQSFKFFINSLNKKLKSDKLTTFVFYTFLLTVICVILYKVSLVNHDIPSIIASLGSPSLEYIPFAGWAKGLIIGLVYPNPHMVMLTVLYVLCAAASLVLSVFWADNYYEDTITCLGETGEIQEAAKKGRTDEILARVYRNKKQMKTTVSVRGTGAKAFLWKSLLIYKKGFISRPVSNFLDYLFFLIVGITLAFLIKPEDNSELVVLLLTITFITSTIAGSVTNPIISELKHAYIFIAPGKLRYKLFYTVLQPIIKFAAQSLLAFVPMLIMGKLIAVDFIVAYLAAVTMGALPVSSGVIVTAVFPDDEAMRKNPFMAMLRSFFMFVYYLPGGIVCALFVLFTWLLTHTMSMDAGLLGFAAGNALAVFLMFIISGKIFSRIEYKQ